MSSGDEHSSGDDGEYENRIERRDDEEERLK